MIAAFIQPHCRDCVARTELLDCAHRPGLADVRSVAVHIRFTAHAVVGGKRSIHNLREESCISNQKVKTEKRGNLHSCRIAPVNR